MIKTIKLASYELRRFKGPMPIIALLFLLLVPTLYGALYLWSNWDPYGKLDQVPVAVVNLDVRSRSTARRSTPATGWSPSCRPTRSSTGSSSARTRPQQGLADGTYYMTVDHPARTSRRTWSAGRVTTRSGRWCQLHRDDANGYVIGRAHRVRADPAGSGDRPSGDRRLLRDGVRQSGHHQDRRDHAATGATQLATGADTVAKGATDLSTGITTAKDGSAQLVAGLADAKAGSSALVTGTADAKAGSASLVTGLTTLDTGAADIALGRARRWPTAMQQLASDVGAGLSALGGRRAGAPDGGRHGQPVISDNVSTRHQNMTDRPQTARRGALADAPQQAGWIPTRRSTWPSTPTPAQVATAVQPDQHGCRTGATRPSTR